VKFPPLPRLIVGAGGSARVVRPARITNNAIRCNGLWMPDSRTIAVVRGLSRERAWWVFFHERSHMELEDGGVKNLPEPDEEAICDAMANARLAELRLRLTHEAARKRPRSSGTRSATGKTR
jgi:hypothetical protein